MTEMLSRAIEGEDRTRGSRLPVVANFVVRKFTEEQYPEGALLAQRIHAQSYIDEQYVTEEAIDADGRLLADIDTARGDNIIYFLGQDDKDDQKIATLRKKFIPEQGDLKDLSGYRNSETFIRPEEIDRIYQHVAKYGLRSVVEISALGKAHDAPSETSMKLIRSVVHDSVRTNPDERWIILFTEHAYRAMDRFFGSTIVRRVGEFANVNDGQEYINPKLRFVPTVIKPASVMETLLSEASDETRLPTERMTRAATLNFMSAGSESSERYKEESTMILRGLRGGMKGAGDVSRDK